MTTVVLLRHGQSEGNVDFRFQGQVDLPLTPLGRSQAECAASYLEKYRFDRIFASSLGRAVETAEAVGKRQGLPVTPEDGFREIFGGLWQMHTFEEIRDEFPADYALWHENIGLARPTGGESVADLFRRVNRAFDRVLTECRGKTVLIATHATPIRALQTRLLGFPPEKMKDVPWVPNASVTAVRIPDGGGAEIPELGTDSFLGGDVTRLPGNI